MNYADDNGQAAHELQLEREQMALHALMECKRVGAKPDAIDTLAAEMGLRREWQRYQTQRTTS